MQNAFEIVTADQQTVDDCGLCGANSLGHERKRAWIRQCLPHGLRYKTIVERATGKTVGIIEYIPAQFAWRGVQAANHMLIHCLQVPKRHSGQGLGSLLIQECIRDARENGMEGVVVLATAAGWCTDNRIYLKHGFEVVDRAAPSFELLAKRWGKGEPPSFGNWKQRLQALGTGVFMYHSKQCPFMRGEKAAARQRWLCAEYGLDVNVIEVADHAMAQANPCVWGTSGIICNGEIVNYVPGGDAHLLKKLRRMKTVR